MATKKTITKSLSDKSAESFAIEEYKTLRSEIHRYQEDVTKIIQFGLTVVGVLLSLQFVQQIQDGSYFCFYLFVPALMIFPIVALIVHRVRQSWKISQYISMCLENRYNLGWETYNIMNRDNPKRISLKYVISSCLIFLIIQILTPAVSFLTLPDQIKSNNNLLPTDYIYWAILTLVLLGIVVYEVLIIREANTTPSIPLR